MSNFSGIQGLDSLEDVKTLIDMLAFRALKTPQRNAFIFDETIEQTYIELWDAVNRVAKFLKNIGVGHQDRVVIIMQNGADFFPAFYGVQRVGGISVPLFPGSGEQRILKIVRFSGAKAVILPSDTPPEMLERYQAAAAHFDVQVYPFSALMGEDVSDDEPFPNIDPEDLAFFQFTSGSTGDSKGVQLSHRNLIANIRQCIGGADITAEDVFVSWLPVYHDLGLITMTMCPFYIGAKLVLLPTTLTEMPKWMQAITTHKATFIAAPDIGYRMALKQVRHPHKYDLSSLQIGLNAAEPVRAQTITAFEQHFNISNVIKPAYGLAEASVGVSVNPRQSVGFKVDERGFVSAGGALPGIKLAIIGDDGEALPPNQIGEIALWSDSSTRGYFNNPEATAGLFWRDGYVFTGDLGYLDGDNDLFIVSRKKNMIKHGGRSVAPQEVEEIVDSLDAVRYSAAVGIDRGGIEGEQVYIFAEVRLKSSQIDQDAPRLSREIVQTLHERLGFRPGRVYLVKPHTIPFTYNGKIQHQHLKNSYLKGILKEEGLLIYPDY